MFDDDAARFRALFPESRVTTVPNIKFDRVPLFSVLESHDETNPLNHLVEPGKPLIILGSVREEEEEAVGNIIEKLTADLPKARVFLFPRHMHRLDAWTDRLSAMGSDYDLRSRLTSERPQVVLWDVFGELTFAYKLAHAAFIGGSLAPLGGQNFLEALACGVIPVTGPSWTNFTWVGQGIVEKGLLDMGSDWKAVAEKLIHHAVKPMERVKIKTMTDEYLQPLRGGTEMVCREIKKMYSERFKH
jgi:3-deoxy-D-manno-octulosonic-acid transferase